MSAALLSREAERFRLAAGVYYGTVSARCPSSWLARGFGQSLEQRLVERLRRLNLRGMAEIGELDQLGARNARRRRFAERRIIAQRRPHARAGEVLADRRRIPGADDEQDRHGEPIQLVNDRLSVDHVVEPGGDGRGLLAAAAAIEAGQHLHPDLVGRLPFAGIVRRPLVSAYAVGRGLQFALAPLIDAKPRRALGLPVFEPDRIDEDELIDGVRVYQPIADGEHAAGRMADDRGRSE